MILVAGFPAWRVVDSLLLKELLDSAPPAKRQLHAAVHPRPAIDKAKWVKIRQHLEPASHLLLPVHLGNKSHWRLVVVD